MSNKSYRIMIAEDDALISESLKEHLQDMGHEVIGITSSFDGAIEILNKSPDFCFLDIRMHGKDVGFDIAEVIQQDYQIPFLFLTSFGDENTVIKASAYQPAAYLVKPFKAADIYSSLEIAMAKHKASTDKKVEIKDGGKTYFVNPDNIVFCKADNVYVEIQMIGKRYIERIGLDRFSERLPDFFQKSHRSYIINTKKISSISSNQIEVAGFSVPLSRSYKAELSKIVKGQ